MGRRGFERDVPVSFASSSPSFASSRFANRLANYEACELSPAISAIACAEAQSSSQNERAHHAALQFRWFPIKDITRFDPMIDHPYRPVKEAHQMTTRQIDFSTEVPAQYIAWNDGSEIPSPDTDLVTSPLSFINICPSCCRTAMRN